MMNKIIEYAPTIVITIIALILLWHFFVGRWVYALLHRFGKLKFSSFDDEKRGMNEHMRFVRRNFRRMQRVKREYYFRLVTDENGEIISEERDGRRYFMMMCLNTGGTRFMSEDWLIEALHFGIISNAEKAKGGMEMTDDRFEGEVPEYNSKVGDIDYFDMAIGMYKDDPIVQMDTKAISNKFFE